MFITFNTNFNYFYAVRLSKCVMPKLIFQISLFMVILLCLSSCEAPRNNPLDPDNPVSTLASINGVIQTEAFPRKPIKDVNVFWKNNDCLVTTDSEGKFSIANVERENGWLCFTKNGFGEDSLFLNWNRSKKKNVYHYLNSTPKISDLFFFSIVENRYDTPPDNQRVKIKIEATISDDENDIDSVFLVNSDLGLRKELEEIKMNRFSQEFFFFDLNVGTIDDIIGKDLFLTVKDKSEKEFVIGSSNVKRIIKQEISILSPKNNEDSVSVTPRLKWKRFLPGFTHKYTVQVYSNEVAPEVVWEKSNIPSDSIGVTVDRKLSGNSFGEYFWVIWATDEYQNKTRSKPATFKILQ